MKSVLCFVVACLLTAHAAPAADTSFRHVAAWYQPARIGLFFHWGLFTGGGKTQSVVARNEPLAYKTPVEFEAAAGDPARVMDNMMSLAKIAGAKYTILTVFHTCAGLMVLYPTQIAAFKVKTTTDFIGAYLTAAEKADIHPVLYLPTDCNNWDNPQNGPCIAQPYTERGSSAYADLLGELMAEMRTRYGTRIEGIWLDGGLPGATTCMPARVHALWPKAVVIANNCNLHDLPDIDFSTTEMLKDACYPDYNRPSGYQRSNAWGLNLPTRDFNEDIPYLNNWWYGGEEESAQHPVSKKFVADPKRLVKLVTCSLGQRGIWNCAVAIGPRIDGTIQPRLAPAVRTLGEFLSWARPAIADTTGPAGTFFEPGWISGDGVEGFYSVTHSTKNPDVFFALVTEMTWQKMNRAVFKTNGHAPRRITDLRTGRNYAFAAPYDTILFNVDWSDISTYGATVLKFEF